MGKQQRTNLWDRLNDEDRLIRPEEPVYLSFEDLREPGPTFRNTTMLVPIESVQAGDEQVFAAAKTVNDPVIDLNPLVSFPAVRSVVASTTVRATRPLPQIDELLLFGRTLVPEAETLANLPGLRKFWAGWAASDRPLVTNSLPEGLEALGVCRHNLADQTEQAPRFAELLRFPKLRQLSLNDCWPKDSLAPLGELTKIVRFRSDAPRGWAALKGWTALEELSAIQAHFANFHAFHGWSRLRSLSIAGRGVGSLDGMEAFRALRQLTLIMMKIEDLAPLTGLPELEDVTLRGSQGVKDLTALGSLPSLKRLTIEKAGIEYRDIVHVDSLRPLANAQQLEQLDLIGTVVDDGDLSPLAGLPALRKIQLHCDLERQVVALRRARPEIEIVWEGGVPPPGEKVGPVYLRPPLEGSIRWWMREDLTELLRVSTNYAAETKLKSALKREDPELLARLDFDTEGGAVTLDAENEKDIRAVASLIGRLAESE